MPEPTTKYDRKVYISIDATGGLDYRSGSLVKADGSPDFQNVECLKGVLRRTIGEKKFISGDVAGRVLHCNQYLQEDGDEFFMVVSDDNIYRESAGSWSSLSAYSGVDGRLVMATQGFDSSGNSIYIICDNENWIKKYDGSSVADLDSADGWKTQNVKGQFPAWYYQHLLIGKTTETGTQVPFRVRWSDLADPEDIVNGSASFVDLVETPGFITGFATSMDRLFCLKGDAIYEGGYVGYPRYFSFNPLVIGTGCAASRTIVVKNNIMFFVGPDAIWMFDGRNFTDISEEIRDNLFGVDSVLNRDYLSKAVAIHIEELNEIWFAFATGADTEPNTVFRYHVGKKSWWKRTLSIPMMAAGLWKESTAVPWTALVGPWTAMIGTWRSGSRSAAFPLVMFGSHDSATDKGYIHQLNFSSFVDNDSSWPSAYWTTKDLIPSQNTRWQEFWIQAKGSSTIELSYSHDGGLTYTSLGTKQPSSSTQYEWLKWSFDFTDPQTRFKLTWGNGAVKVREKIAWYYPRKR
jgi:hypothetical protein